MLLAEDQPDSLFMLFGSDVFPRDMAARSKVDSDTYVCDARQRHSRDETLVVKIPVSCRILFFLFSPERLWL